MPKKVSKRRIKIDEIKTKNPGKLDAAQAVELLLDFSKQACSSKFSQTFEVAAHLGIDTKANDQQVRASVNLPAGTGNIVRIAVIAKGEKVKDAKDAGAIEAGTEDLVKKIEEGWMDFDVLVATPDCMPLLGKLGRVLGPRGLMPNPKDGTVTADVKKAVKDLQAGKVTFRAEKTGAVVHVPFGKASFSKEDLMKNLQAVVQEIQKHKPSSSKGVYLKSVFVTTTHGPSFAINPESALVTTVAA